MVKIYLILFIFIFNVGNIIAQGPPIFSDSPIMLGLDGGGIRTFGKFTFTQNGSSYTQLFAIPYNFATNFQVGIVQPFIVKSSVGHETKRGFGNLTLFAKHLIFKKDGKANTFRSLLKFTQTLKTGSEVISPQFTISKIDFVIGYITTKFGLYGSAGYAFFSDSLPDKLFYNLAIGYPLLPQKYPPFQLNLFFELNGNHSFEVNRELILLSPGIQLITSSGFLVETGIQIPIVDDSNFIKYSASLGIRCLIF